MVRDGLDRLCVASPVGASHCADFAWDAIVSAMFYGPGFILHGVVCFSIFLNSFRPHCHGFAGIFLLWVRRYEHIGHSDASQELSTIPLNINWFLDKTGQTGSTLQLINGAALLLSFFGVRLAMGVWSTWVFASNLFSDHVRAKMSPGTPLLYFTALMSLNCARLSSRSRADRSRFERLLVPRDDSVAAEALRQVGARQVEAVSSHPVHRSSVHALCGHLFVRQSIAAFTPENTGRSTEDAQTGTDDAQTRTEASGDGRGRASDSLPPSCVCGDGRDLRAADAPARSGDACGEMGARARRTMAGRLLAARKARTDRRGVATASSSSAKI